ncbi:DUF1579 family protein [Sphingomonas cavernae]|nr:DUF1579 family protein [Sphingomonas cavernae]
MRYGSAAAVLIALGLASAGGAQEPAKTEAGPTVQAPPKLSAGQRKYQSIFPVNVPDEVLEPLKAEEGVWDADVELYVGDIAKQPIRKKGVQTNRLASKGNAMLNAFRYDDGSYEGTGMWGWDAYTNRYTGVWIDSDTHLVRHDIGYYDLQSRIFRWEADTMQPDGVTTRMRIVQQFKGDVRTFQIDVMDAKTGLFKKLIYMTFTRRAAP